MDHSEDPSDPSFVPMLVEAAPKEARAFLALKAVAERKDGVIPEKYRELISVAVALTTRCSYGIDAHAKNAVEAGATREELAETVFIAAALRAGGAVGQRLLALKLFEAAREVRRGLIPPPGGDRRPANRPPAIARIAAR